MVEEEKNNNEVKNKNKVKKKFTAGMMIVSILLFILSFSGIFAFIYSLNCFRYKSSIIENVLGLLLAIFTGPFYFIYYFFNTNYCRVKK